MPRHDPAIHKSVLPALAAAGALALLAGCSSASSSPGASAGGGGGAGAVGGGAGDNAVCASVAKNYAAFLAGYTPAKGGLWDVLGTDLAVQASTAGNTDAQLAVDVTAVSQDAGALADPDNPDGYQVVVSSELGEFDSDLKTLASYCGITLTPPVPHAASAG